MFEYVMTPDWDAMFKARPTLTGPVMFLTNKDNNTVFPISANDPKAMKAARTEKHMAIIAKMVGQTTGAKGGDHKKYVAHLAMIHSDKAKDKTPGEFEEHLLSEVEKHSGKKREELGEAVRADLKDHAGKHAGKVEKKAEKAPKREKKPSAKTNRDGAEKEAVAQDATLSVEPAGVATKISREGFADARRDGKLHEVHEMLDKHVKSMKFEAPAGSKGERVAKGLTVYKDKRGWGIRHNVSGADLTYGPARFASQAEALRGAAYLDLHGADASLSAKEYGHELVTERNFEWPESRSRDTISGFSDVDARDAWIKKYSWDNNLNYAAPRKPHQIEAAAIERGLTPSKDERETSRAIIRHDELAHAIRNGQSVPDIISATDNFAWTSLYHGKVPTQLAKHFGDLKRLRKDESARDKLEWSQNKSPSISSHSDAMKAIGHAVSTDDTRYGLNGYFVGSGSDGSAHVVATDGHRISMAPVKDASAFQAGKIHSRHAENETIDGEFPDYEQLFKLQDETIKAGGHTSVVDRGALQQVAAAVHAIQKGVGKGATSTMELQNRGGSLYAGIRHGDTEEFVKVGRAPAQMVGKSQRIGINAKYLMDALKSGNGSSVRFSLPEAEYAPLGFDLEDGTRHIISPLRLQ